MNAKVLIGMLSVVLFSAVVAMAEDGGGKKNRRGGKMPEGAKTVEGVVKAVDAGQKTLTLTVKEGDKETDVVFSLGDTARVSIGKERGKTLADVKVGDKAAVMYTEEGGIKKVFGVRITSDAKPAEKPTEKPADNGNG